MTHDVGSVGCLKVIKEAISVARSVMEHTEETLLVGSDGRRGFKNHTHKCLINSQLIPYTATDFAAEMGFVKQDLHTNKSRLAENSSNHCTLNTAVY